MTDDLAIITADGTVERGAPASPSDVVTMPWTIWMALPSEQRNNLIFQVRQWSLR